MEIYTSTSYSRPIVAIRTQFCCLLKKTLSQFYILALQKIDDNDRQPDSFVALGDSNGTQILMMNQFGTSSSDSSLIRANQVSFKVFWTLCQIIVFQVLESSEMETTLKDGGDFKLPSSPQELKELLKALNLLHQNSNKKASKRKVSPFT